MISTSRREKEVTVIFHRNEVEMISRNVIRKSLNPLTPTLFLLLCCSLSAFAQSSSERQELTRIAFNNTPVKAAISTLIKQTDLNVVFGDIVKEDRLTIELNDVSIEQALKIFFVAKRLQARLIEEKTILVFPDNETNHRRYGQYELWPAKSDGNK
jgi:type II secretory pathway component HofQ